MKTKLRFAFAGVVIGALLMLSPFFSVVATMLGMASAHNTLGQSGIADPKALSEDISHILISVFLGPVLFLAGAAILIVSLVVWLKLRKVPPPLPPPEVNSGSSQTPV